MDEINRRDVLKLAGPVMGLPAVGQWPAAFFAAAAQPLLSHVASVPTSVNRTFVAPQMWGNRLEDWRVNQGRIECAVSGRGRTIAALTRALNPGGTVAR